MVGPKMQAFCPRTDMLKGNHCILRIRGAPVRQKLGMILENKVVQKLKLEKNVFSKKWSPKLSLFDKLVLPVVSKYNDFLSACRFLGKNLAF